MTAEASGVFELKGITMCGIYFDNIYEDAWSEDDDPKDMFEDFNR